MHVINIQPARVVSDHSQFPEIEIARDTFSSGRTLDVEFRRQQLNNLLQLFNDKENQQRICDAVYKDLHKSKLEAMGTEVHATRKHIIWMLQNLNKLTATKILSRSLLALTDSATIRYDPHGVVLILGTWNFPFYVLFIPLVGAIAAGNCAIVKPSELAEHSAALMLELLPKFLDAECYHVVLGDVDRTKALLTNRFDYIFFTGSTQVGKSILQVAANYLTPVTLELGGKSPVFLDREACTKTAVRRIVWGKIFNAGQTCVGVDYLICSKETQDKFIAFAKEILQEFYGKDEQLQQSKEIGRIININHYIRLKNLMNRTRGTILLGGEMDEKDLWIEPTFVGNVRRHDSLMEGEIFGPLLPIVTVCSIEEAIAFMQSYEKPLALYIFSHNQDVINNVLDAIPSGGVCINDVIVHIDEPRLPFGGIGHSGMGQAHGKYSFRAFSHPRTVLHRGLSFISEKVLNPRFPPTTQGNLRLIKFGSDMAPSLNLNFGFFKYLLMFGLGYLSSYLVYKL